MSGTASEMTPQALAALLQFYAGAGVDTLCEETTVDRFAQSADQAQKRGPRSRATGDSSVSQTASGAPAAPNAPAAGPASQPAAAASRSAPPPAVSPAQQASHLTVPGEAAFEDARALAASATTIVELRQALEGYTGCNLRHSAKNLVFADGNPEADVMFIGEAPGRDEDLQGVPFVGRAGQLLDRTLASIGLDRDNAYITNMIFWRPPGNRTPAPHEIELCRPFIQRHVALAAPKIVVLLGNVAAKSLLGTEKGILSLRGGWMTYSADGLSIPALPTLHPAYLLRNPLQKRLAWADLLSLRARLDSLDSV